MSRTFDNLLGGGTAFIDGTMSAGFSYPFTVNFWFYPTYGVGVNTMVVLHNTSDDQAFRCNINASTVRVQFVANDGTIANAVSSASYTASAWNMFTGLATSTTNRSVYVNNDGIGSNSTSKNPTTPTAWGLGGSWAGGVAVPIYEGRLAEFAIWNDILTADERSSLYTGAKPSSIRPQNLKVYAPLVRDVYEMRETTTSISVTDTTIDEHVRRYG